MIESGNSWFNIISLGIGALITSIVWFLKTKFTASINTSTSDSSCMRKDQILVDRNLYSEFVQDYPLQRIQDILARWHNIICRTDELKQIASLNQKWVLSDKKFHNQKIQSKLETIISNSKSLL
jgi:hypothetical protein